MSQLAVELHWQRAEKALETGRFSNEHIVQYNATYDVQVDAAPDWGGNPSNTNPETGPRLSPVELSHDDHPRTPLQPSHYVECCARHQGPPAS